MRQQAAFPEGGDLYGLEHRLLIYLSNKGLLTALSFGSPADTYERKVVMLLSFTSVFLHLVWIMLICG